MSANSEKTLKLFEVSHLLLNKCRQGNIETVLSPIWKNMKTGLMFIDLRKKALSLEVEIGIMKGGNVVWVLADCR